LSGVSQLVAEALRAWEAGNADAVAASVGGISQMLGSRDCRVRSAAVEGLSALSQQIPSALVGLLPRVVELVEDQDSDVRWHAARVLADIGTSSPEIATSVVPALVAYRKDVGARNRSSLPASTSVVLPIALFLFGLIVGGYVHSEAARREQAGLGVRVSPEAAAALRLVDGLRDPDGAKRCLAARTYAQLGAAEIAVPVLTECLDDPSANTRREAARTLVSLGEAAAPAVPALTERLEDPDLATRVLAAQALGRVGASAADVLAGLVGCLRDSDSVLRGAAAKALGDIGQASPEVIAALTSLCHDSSPAVRGIAAQSLGMLGDKGTAIATLTELVNAEDPVIRLNAARTLVELGEGEAAVPALTELAQSNETMVREAARETLRRARPG